MGIVMNSRNQIKAARTGLLAWLMLFVLIPVLNAQPQTNGQWIELCTSQGVQLVLVEDFYPQDSNAEKPSDRSHCPCTSDAISIQLNDAVPAIIGRTCYSTFNVQQSYYQLNYQLKARSPPKIS